MTGPLDVTQIRPPRIGSNAEIIIGLEETRASIERFSEKIEKSVLSVHKEYALLSSRVKRIEDGCASERVSMGRLETWMDTEKAAHERFSKSLGKLESVAERLAKVEGRQEGMMNKLGKPVGWTTLGLVLFQLYQGFLSGAVPPQVAPTAQQAPPVK